MTEGSLNPVIPRERGATPNLEALSARQRSLAGMLAYALLPLRQKTVRANLRRAFGEALSETEIKRLAIAFYAHFATGLWEFFSLPLASRATRATMVRVENGEIFLEALEAGHGVLLFGGHLGNFELALTCVMLSHPEMGERVNVLRRPFKPAWLERLVRRRFARVGIGVIEKKRSMFEILRRLGANQAVCFPMDQHAAPREGVLVNFFGRPAWTFRSLAVIGRRSGAPIIPASTWRERRGCHVFRFEEPLTPIVTRDFAQDIRANTQLYNDTLERMILRHPEQWIWNHRRWKEG